MNDYGRIITVYYVAGNVWEASCPCGWQSKPQASEQDAKERAGVHLDFVRGNNERTQALVDEIKGGA